MNTRNDPYKAHCLKCNYSWTKKSTVDPKVCPACNSRNWNNQKKNDHTDHKHHSYYLIFNDKKASLIDFAVPELSPSELVISAQFEGFDMTARVMQLDSTEFNSLRQEDLVTSGALFEYERVHRTESKYIFEVWNTIDTCIICRNEITRSNEKEVYP